MRRRVDKGVGTPDAVLSPVAGVRDGFAGLVAPHLPAMAHLPARLAPDADRDDVLQEALTGAWRLAQVRPVRPLSTLTPTVQGPSAIQNGTTVTFTVRLANDTDTPGALAPCPEFIALLASSPKAQTRIGIRGPLNCGQAPG